MECKKNYKDTNPTVFFFFKITDDLVSRFARDYDSRLWLRLQLLPRLSLSISLCLSLSLRLSVDLSLLPLRRSLSMSMTSQAGKIVMNLKTRRNFLPENVEWYETKDKGRALVLYKDKTIRESKDMKDSNLREELFCL